MRFRSTELHVVLYIYPWSFLCFIQYELIDSFQTELFGGDLSDLVSNENSVPPLVDKLIQDIEARGK